MGFEFYFQFFLFINLLQKSRPFNYTIKIYTRSWRKSTGRRTGLLDVLGLSGVRFDSRVLCFVLSVLSLSTGTFPLSINIYPEGLV